MSHAEAEPSTPVQRSTEALLLYLALSVALGGGSAYLWNDDHGGWAFVVAWIAVAMVYVAFTQSWRANCPVCHTPLNGLSNGVCGPCGHCMRYLKMENASVQPLEEGYVAGVPMFAIPWDHIDRLPNYCCGCGQDAVRFEAISSLSGGFRASAQVPYCDTCRNGAAIQQGTKTTGAAPTADPSTYLSVTVKSHFLYVLVMSANHPGYLGPGVTAVLRTNRPGGAQVRL